MTPGKASCAGGRGLGHTQLLSKQARLTDKGNPPKICLRPSPSLPPPPCCPESFSHSQPTRAAGYGPLSCESKVMAHSTRAPRERSMRHTSFGLPASSDFSLSWPRLRSHATCPATTTGISPTVWGLIREDRTGVDVGTSPISLNLHARAGACFPPDSNTSSPKPFSCKRTPPVTSRLHLHVTRGGEAPRGEQQKSRGPCRPGFTPTCGQEQTAREEHQTRTCSSYSPKPLLGLCGTELPGPQQPTEKPDGLGRHLSCPARRPPCHPTSRESKMGRMKRHAPFPWQASSLWGPRLTLSLKVRTNSVLQRITIPHSAGLFS